MFPTNMPNPADITQAAGDIIGRSGSTTERGSGTTSGTSLTSGTQTTGLEIDPVAIQGLVEELLAQSGGLADIFSQEQASGIYSSSTASKLAADFSAQVIGEVAALQAKQVTTQESAAEFEESSTTKSKQSQDQAGLIEETGNLLGGLF